MIYLLDTDSIIFMIRGLRSSNPKTDSAKQVKIAGERIAATGKKAWERGHSISVSAITLAELDFGAQLSGKYAEERNKVDRILSPFEVHPFDGLDCVVSYGMVRSGLERTGNRVGAMDMLIAAHALALGATLVTNNTKDFAKITKLKLVNWSSPDRNI